ncbi:MAG: dihydroxyacetone kinase subunit DhaK [Lachnospiraceae bacterium]|nr:dihydroxyacetone kinase subunit DhaK [Lachnospiraceae bacterium]
MKKLINAPEAFVYDTLDGIYRVHADAVTFTDNSKKAMVRRHPVPGKVALVTGGGSGHLPLFLGYIGDGMLDGCSVGEVFASPGVDDMLSVTKAADNGAGVLYIFGNYGGDRMNFRMASEQAGFEAGIRVLTVIGKDDVAIENPDTRRGIAGIFFVYKCAGAAASEMLPLDEVYRIASKASANVFTMGVSLSACTLPRVGHPSFEIAEDEMEIGMGIHGEPGVRRTKIMSSQATVDEMLENILSKAGLEAGDEVSVLVNGLGATPLEEQYIAAGRVQDVLKEKGIRVFKTYVGEFATSMEMAGLSVSILKLDRELKHYLCAPADALMFRQHALSEDAPCVEADLLAAGERPVYAVLDSEEVPKQNPENLDCSDMKRLFSAFRDAALEHREELIRLDSVAGDGDLGITMADGFTAVEKLLSEHRFSDIGELFYAAGKHFSVAAPSSLGTLISFGFIGAGKALRGKSEVSYAEFAKALEAFEEAVASLGGAKVGDKTFLDGFDPAVRLLISAGSSDMVRALLPEAAAAARRGAEQATDLVAKFGRISFRGEGSRGIVDPGSVFAALLIQTAADTLS